MDAKVPGLTRLPLPRSYDDFLTSSILPNETGDRAPYEITRVRPGHAGSYWIRGHYWMDKKEYQKAIDDFTEAIRLEPNEFMHHYFRGLAQLEMKDYGNAIKDFDQVLRIMPKNSRRVRYARQGSVSPE